MGCGASRFHANAAEVILAKAQPIFLHRLEEIRKRNRHPQTLEENLSKKELLLHDREDNDNIASSNIAGKGQSSPDDNESCVTSDGSKGGSEKLPIKEASNKGSGSIIRGGIGTCTMVNSNCKEGRSRGNEDNDDAEKGGKIVESLAKEEIKAEHSMDVGVKNEGDDDKDDNDERMLCNEHYRSCSLSFRDYLTDNMEDDKNEGLEDDLPDLAPIDEINPILSKEPVTTEVKKEKRRRSFKMALPKGKPLAVKNLLNVRSCMSSANPANDHARLLSAKTPV